MVLVSLLRCGLTDPNWYVLLIYCCRIACFLHYFSNYIFVVQVCQKDLPCLHLLYEVLVAMFSEDYDDMLEKAAKKRLARERLQADISSITSKSAGSEARKKEANL